VVGLCKSLCVIGIKIVTFVDNLKDSGWTEVINNLKYKKGDWAISYDTSSWIEVSTINNQRVFDVPVPKAGKEQWTINLIEHLCKTDDEIYELRIQNK